MTPVMTDVWGARKSRVAVLQQRYPFALQVLDLYGALLPVQEAAFLVARAAPPAPDRIAGYVAERVVTGVLEVTLQHGSPQLIEALSRSDSAADPLGVVAAWMSGDAQVIAERYVARASLGPVLEAMGELAAPAFGTNPGDRHCPRCGGPPQVSYSEPTGDGRRLECARCHAEWGYPRTRCVSCGEQHAQAAGPAAGKREPAEPPPDPVFPHVRIEGCEACHRYLLNVDVGTEDAAVPLVDEMAAVPLDLFARDSGLTKITPNLMGL